jgi:sensor histidine kinase YesM
LFTSSLSDTKFKAVFIAWWVVWSILHIAVLINYGFSPARSFADSLISNTLLAATCWLIGNNMRYYLPGKEKYWYVLTISVGLTAVWLLFARGILWLLFKNDTAYVQSLRQSSNIRFGIAFLINGCMAMISLLWHTQMEQKITDARKAEAEQIARDAELYKLRQQLQPHFLFNSLNSISALTGTQPEKARHMIQQLSDFLRGTLKKDEQQWNTLEEELQYLQLYLEIEKVRFGYRLQTNIITDDEVLQMKLPSLLLQPLVENAIKFGLYDTIGEVTISIIAKKINESLEITVENPFDAETSQTLQGTGFGISSIQRRLFLLFARHDLLKTQSVNNHFITAILIPQII